MDEKDLPKEDKKLLDSAKDIIEEGMSVREEEKPQTITKDMIYFAIIGVLAALLIGTGFQNDRVTERYNNLVAEFNELGKECVRVDVEHEWYDDLNLTDLDKYVFKNDTENTTNSSQIG